jgi:hypothetical protein
VLTMFDETQVTKVDKLQGDVRDMRAKLEAFRAHESPGGSVAGSVDAARTHVADALAGSVELAKQDAVELLSHLQTKSAAASESSEHYRSLARATEEIERKLSSMGASPRLDSLDAELVTVEATLVQLTKQPPYTLLMMRVVEIGLPLLACFFSLLFVLRYALTETRSREIKDLLAQRHAEHDTGPDPAVV